MSVEWAFKVLLVGDGGTGKSSFLRYNKGHCYNHFDSIGITFSNADIRIENNQCYKLHFWEIKDGDKYNSLYPNHFKSTVGCLLFFDISNYKSFSNLPNWVRIIREYAGAIPIILIGTKVDLNYDIYYQKVVELVNKYQLEGYYFISINLGFNKEIIFKHLIKKMINYSQASIKKVFINNLNQSVELSYQEKKENFIKNIAYIRESSKNNEHSLNKLHRPSESSSLSKIYTQQKSDKVEIFSSRLYSLRESKLVQMEDLFQIRNGVVIRDNKNYKNLSLKEKEFFYKFLNYFSYCPICKNENEEKFLMRFYFDSDPDKILLKKNLIKLMSESKNIKNNYYKKVELGILCCDCFRKFFEKR